MVRMDDFMNDAILDWRNEEVHERDVLFAYADWETKVSQQQRRRAQVQSLVYT